METTTALLIALPVLIVLAAVVLFASARRRDTGEAIGVLSRETRRRDRGRASITDDEPVVVTGREVERAAALERREGGGVATITTAPPVAWVPPDPDTLGVTRRQFLNRGIVTFFAVGLSGFGAAVVAFLYPKLGGGFGSKILVGTISDIEGRIEQGEGFAYYPEGRMWITRYPASALEKARAVYDPAVLPGMEAGLVALYQKCPHLGCRVPECKTSQWFECPCHGSQYNQAGEKKGGPAPRGMDRFSTTVENNVLTVDTTPSGIKLGPPIGTNTTGQEAEGPHCVTGGAGH